MDETLYYSYNEKTLPNEAPVETCIGQEHMKTGSLENCMQIEWGMRHDLVPIKPPQPNF